MAGRDIFMGPLIDERALTRFRDFGATARRDGKMLAGGDVLSGGLNDHGAYVNADDRRTAGCCATDQSELDLFLEYAEAGALYVNRASGATTGAWPGVQSFCG